MARPRFVAGPATSAPWNGLKGEIIHEYDEWGSHRLTHNGRGGDWANFADHCVLKIADRTFKAYTDYHSDSNEIEEVIAVLPRTLSELYNNGE